MSTDTPPMTDTTNEPDWLEDALATLQSETIDYTLKDLGTPRRLKALRNEAHAAITAHLLAAVEEVIGEDEEQPDFQRLPQVYDTTDLLLERNELRAKQRQRLAVLVTSKNRGV